MKIEATGPEPGRAAVRRLPLRAGLAPGVVHLRAWAPDRRLVELFAEAPAPGELLG